MGNEGDEGESDDERGGREQRRTRHSTNFMNIRRKTSRRRAPLAVITTRRTHQHRRRPPAARRVTRRAARPRRTRARRTSRVPRGLPAYLGRRRRAREGGCRAWRLRRAPACGRPSAPRLASTSDLARRARVVARRARNVARRVRTSPSTRSGDDPRCVRARRRATSPDPRRSRATRNPRLFPRL